MKKSSMKLKGFTLTEMIVVIAIIGILSAILAPTMTTYYWKSRVKSANTDAKLVYNAAQTAAQRFIAKDRTASDANKSELDGTLVIYYDHGNFEYAGSLPIGYAAPTKPVSSTSYTGKDKAVAEIVASVNKTVSNAEQRSWAVYIQNYIVEGSIAADNANTDLVGYYTTGTIRTPDNRPTRLYTAWFDGASSGGSGYPSSLTEVIGRYSSSAPSA